MTARGKLIGDLSAANERTIITSWLKTWARNLGFPEGAVIHHIACRIENLDHHAAAGGVTRMGGDGVAGSVGEAHRSRPGGAAQAPTSPPSTTGDVQ